MDLVGGQAGSRRVVANALGSRRGVDAIRRQALGRAHDMGVLPLDVRELVDANAASNVCGSLQVGVADVAQDSTDEVARHGRSRGQSANVGP